MNNPTIENLRQGQTVYIVRALGKESFISKYLVMSKPYFYVKSEILKNTLWIELAYCELSYNYNIKGLRSSHSLGDMGVDKKHIHNKHRTFFSRRKAEKYLKWALKNSKKVEMYEFFSYYSYDTTTNNNDKYQSIQE